MNYTKSGAIAVGAPHSRARYKEEARHCRINLNKLLETEEGVNILKWFFGNEWESVKEINLLKPCSDYLENYLDGFIMGLHLEDKYEN